MDYAAEGSKCYDNNSANCVKYGRLYDWATAKKVCPTGWHLPSNAEWDALMTAVSGSTAAIMAGAKLKARSGWNGGNGTDNYGFSALPGGLCESDGKFYSAGDIGYWWSSTEDGNGKAYQRGMTSDEDASYGSHNKSYLHSVRCVKD